MTKNKKFCSNYEQSLLPSGKVIHSSSMLTSSASKSVLFGLLIAVLFSIICTFSSPAIFSKSSTVSYWAKALCVV